LAAHFGLRRIIIRLVGNGALPDAADEHNKGTPLLCAIRNGQIETMRLMLQKYLVSPNVRSREDYSPMFFAINRYGLEAVSELLACNTTNPNFPVDKRGTTPLMYALEKLKFRVVDLILNDDRVDVGIHYDQIHESALSFAVRKLSGCFHKHNIRRLEDIIQQLVENESLNRGPSMWNISLATLAAADTGHEQMFKYLFSKDIFSQEGTRSNDMLTLLRVAVKRKSVPIVKAIFARFDDAHESGKNKKWASIIHSVMWNYNVEMLDLLLANVTLNGSVLLDANIAWYFLRTYVQAYRWHLWAPLIEKYKPHLRLQNRHWHTIMEHHQYICKRHPRCHLMKQLRDLEVAPNFQTVEWAKEQLAISQRSEVDQKTMRAYEMIVELSLPDVNPPTRISSSPPTSPTEWYKDWA
jgi:hypothetical protein